MPTTVVTPPYLSAILSSAVLKCRTIETPTKKRYWISLEPVSVVFRTYSTGYSAGSFADDIPAAAS